MIGSSVTDPSWLAQVPSDLPVLAIAEGLVMYLKEDEGKELFRRIVNHFPSGQFAFDGLERMWTGYRVMVKVARLLPALSRMAVLYRLEF